MTPKEKAKEIVEKYRKIFRYSNPKLMNYETKQCALIAVDEILKTGIIATKDYWEEVKNEILKL